VPLEPPPRRHGRRAIALATALTLAGIGGYFVVVQRLGGWLPGVRNHAIPNLLVVAGGVILALVAARRGRTGVRALAVVDVLLAGRFAWMLFFGLAVPAVPGPRLGTPAPDVTLTDEQGRAVRLADFRGSPLLLVFYRGHW
jgi:hypothetical protein